MDANEVSNQKKTAILFVVCFFLVMLYPLVGEILFPYVTLSGVTAESEMAELSVKSVMDGTYQESLNTRWENHFPGRSALIKIRGQLLYSLLRESPNENVVIGADDYLFEPGFIFRELAIDGATYDEYFDGLRDKLIRLNDLMEQNDKELYLFITPNKVHYFSEKVPARYQLLRTDQGNNYQKFVQMLQTTQLHYFDSHAYIGEMPEGTWEAPVFYRTGTHWSCSYGYSAAVAFADYISAVSEKWNLGEMRVWEAKTAVPEYPDADLYDSLNIIQNPTESYYTAGITVDEPGDGPGVFYRGGSFMGQSLSGLTDVGVFPEFMHLENNYYYTNDAGDSGTISSYTSYEELDIGRYMEQTDILILEVNEAIISSMSFGFVDYLLEHPDLVVKAE